MALKIVKWAEPTAKAKYVRFWTEWRPNPVLDGAAIGLKLGLGGGLRLYWGGNFVVRGDVGWSPDGVGVYFDVGHIF